MKDIKDTFSSSEPIDGIVLEPPQASSYTTNVKPILFTVFNQAVIILLIVLGTLYTFISFFSLPHSAPAVVLFTLFCTVLFLFLFSVKHAAVIGLPVIAGLLGIAGYYSIDELTQGFVVTCNHVIWAINHHLNWTLYDYITNSTPEQYSYLITLFLVFCIVVFTGFVSYAVIRRHSCIMAAVLVLPVLAFGFYYTMIPNYLAVTLLVDGFIGLTALRFTHVSEKSAKQSFIQISSKHSNQPVYVPAKNLPAQVACARASSLILCAVLLFAALFALFFPKQIYTRPQFADRLKAQLTTSFQNISFSDLQNLFSTKTYGGIGEGNLGNTDQLSFQNVTALKITTNYPTSMYLRGYVGSVYTGRKWETMPQSRYDTYSANSTVFSPMNQISEYYNLLFKSNQFMTDYYKGKFTEKDTVTYQVPTFNYSLQVKNENANRKYIYTPYGLSTRPYETLMGNVSYMQDSFIRANDFWGVNQYRLNAVLLYGLNTDDTRKFTQQLFDSPLPCNAYADINYRYFTGSTPDEKNYIEYEKNYRKFVYENYLSVPQVTENTIKKLLHNADLAEFTKGFSNYTAAKQAVDTLLAHTYYTLSPGKTPSDKDFVSYFLDENKKGFCTHYASAAAMIFRTMGIPTRYVEGYVVTKNDYTNAHMKKSDASYSFNNQVLDIKDTNAHAWVEVYLDGYGWSPVETTPGYSEETTFLPENEQSSQPDRGSVSSAPEMSEPDSSSLPDSTPDSSSVADITKTSSVTKQNDNEGSPLSAIFGTILFLLFSVAALLILRRKLALQKRNRQFHQENLTEATLCMYRYLAKLFSFYGVPYQSSFPLEYAERVENDCPFIKKGAFTKFTVLACKAQFSKHVITPEELDGFCSFTQKCAENIFILSSSSEKWILRYLYNLY